MYFCTHIGTHLFHPDTNRKIQPMKQQTFSYQGAQQRSSLMDLQLPNTEYNNLVLFVHGYKGFKDWGAWSLVQAFFIANGIGFAKINLSHNGGTTKDPIDFPDLEAFGLNRYTYELEDITAAMDKLAEYISLNNVNLWLIGHSRGGGDVVLSAHHPRIKGIITWASIADIARRFPKGEELEKWRETGVRFVENTRTHQKMPHYFSFYEDWKNNQDRLNIQLHASRLSKPALHIHGTHDQAVHCEEAKELARWTNGTLHLIPEANHTFGASHPWREEHLPKDLQLVFNAIKIGK
jgi:pimeloyl-ACP methyl ester carboxylesterase